MIYIHQSMTNQEQTYIVFHFSAAQPNGGHGKLHLYYWHHHALHLMRAKTN